MKIFETQFEKGSFTDNLGNPIIPVSSLLLKRNDKGFGLFFPSGNTTQYATFGNPISTTSSFTYVIWVYLTKVGVWGSLLGPAGGGSPGVGIIRTSTGIIRVELYGSSNGRQLIDAIPYANWSSGWNHIIISIDRSTLKCYPYINGVALSSISFLDPGTIVQPIWIGSCSGITFVLAQNSYVNKIIGYNYVLSEQERSKSYSDFLNPYIMCPDEKYPQQSILNKPMDLSREKDNTLGTPVMPIPLNFLDASWTVVGGAIKDSNDMFHTFSNDGIRKSFAAWTVGMKYRIRARIKGTNLVTVEIRDYTGINVYWSFVGTGSFVTYDTTFVVSAINNNGIYLITVTGSTVEFDYIYIESITGLVAAYSFLQT